MKESNTGNCRVKLIVSGRGIELLNFYVSRLLLQKTCPRRQTNFVFSLSVHVSQFVIRDKNRGEKTKTALQPSTRSDYETKIKPRRVSYSLT